MVLSRLTESIVLLFGSLHPVARDAVVLSMVGLVSLVDSATPSAISLTGFYLLPIGLAVWYSRKVVAALVIAFSVGAVEYMISSGLSENTPFWQLVLGYSSPPLVFLGFAELTHRQKIVVQRLLDESRTDVLTGIRNRRSFMELAQFELSRLIRSNQVGTLALIDLDNFKLINDTQGHAVGDALLVAVSRCMVTTLREIDVVARLGGDEFVVLLPETNSETARGVLERLHTNLRMLLQSFDKSASTSIGAIVIPAGNEAGIAELLAAVDTVMYSVKSTSKDGLAFKVESAVA